MRFLESFIVYLVVVNIYGFYLCYKDKRNSIKNKWRVCEKRLLFICLIGGCYGFYIAMRLFHHKTKKLKFEIGVPILMMIWVFIIVRVVML